MRKMHRFQLLIFLSAVIILTYFSLEGGSASYAPVFIRWGEYLRIRDLENLNQVYSSQFATPLWIAWVKLADRVISVLNLEQTSLGRPVIVKSVVNIALVLWCFLCLRKFRRQGPKWISPEICCVIFFAIPLAYNSVIQGQYLAVTVLMGSLLVAYIRDSKILKASILQGGMLALSPLGFCILPYFVLEFYPSKSWKKISLGLALSLLIALTSYWIFKRPLYQGTLRDFLNVQSSEGEFNLFALLGMNFQPLSSFGNETVPWVLSCLAITLSTLVFYFLGLTKKLQGEGTVRCGAALAVITTLVLPGMTMGAASIALVFFPFLGVRTKRLAGLFCLLVLVVLFELHYQNRIGLQTSGLISMYNVDPRLWVTPMAFFNVLAKLGIAIGFIVSMKSEELSICYPSSWIRLMWISFTKAFEKLILDMKVKPTPSFLDKKTILTVLILTTISSWMTFRELGKKFLPTTFVKTNSSWVILPENREPISAIWLMKSHHPAIIKAQCLGDNQVQITRADHIEANDWFYSQLERPCNNGLELEFINTQASTGHIYEMILQEVSNRKVTAGRVCGASGCSSFANHALFDESSQILETPDRSDGAIWDEPFNFISGIRSLRFPEEMKLDTVHPFLGRATIWLSMKIFGIHPWAWRFPGALAGALLPAAIYFLALLLFSNRKTAFFAGVLSLFDCARLGLSRVATVDSQLTFWIVLTHVFLILYLRKNLCVTNPSFKKASAYLVLVLLSISMGAALSTKWVGFFHLPFILFLLGGGFLLRRKLLLVSSRSHLFLECVCLIMIPILIYIIVYIPFLPAQSHGSLPAILKHQQAMFKIQSSTMFINPHASQFTSWPFMDIPTATYLRYGMAKDSIEMAYIFGNPVIWWAILPLFGFLIYRGEIFRKPQFLYLLLTFLAFYLPWVGIRRPTYLYHFFPASVFGILAIAFGLDHLSKRYRLLVVGYLTLTAASFFWFYPIVHPKCQTLGQVASVRWFGSWFLPLDRQHNFRVQRNDKVVHLSP